MKLDGKYANCNGIAVLHRVPGMESYIYEYLFIAKKINSKYKRYLIINKMIIQKYINQYLSNVYT